MVEQEAVNFEVASSSLASGARASSQIRWPGSYDQSLIDSLLIKKKFVRLKSTKCWNRPNGRFFIFYLCWQVSLVTDYLYDNQAAWKQTRFLDQQYKKNR